MGQMAQFLAAWKVCLCFKGYIHWLCGWSAWHTETGEMQWRRKPLSVVFLYASVALLWWWERNIPSPGEAATALAVVAAVMTFRGEMRGKEQLAWTLLLFSFMFLEITSINTEREASEYIRSVAIEQQRKSFEKIGKGIEGSIVQSEKQFEKTMQKETQISELSRRNLENVTGGNSYAVVEPALMQWPSTDVPLSITNRGGDILTGVSVTLYSTGIWMRWNNESIAQMKTGSPA
jgi:hypothetical protein